MLVNGNLEFDEILLATHCTSYQAGVRGRGRQSNFFFGVSFLRNELTFLNLLLRYVLFDDVLSSCMLSLFFSENTSSNKDGWLRCLLFCFVYSSRP